MLSKEIITPVLIISRAGKSRTPLATPKNIMTCCSSISRGSLIFASVSLLIVVAVLTTTSLASALSFWTSCTIRADLMVLQHNILASLWLLTAAFYNCLESVQQDASSFTGLMQQIRHVLRPSVTLFGIFTLSLPLVNLALMIMISVQSDRSCNTNSGNFSIVWFYIDASLFVVFLLLICYAAYEDYSHLSERKRTFQRMKSLQYGLVRMHGTHQGWRYFCREFADFFMNLQDSQKESLLPVLLLYAIDELTWELREIPVVIQTERCLICHEGFNTLSSIVTCLHKPDLVHRDCLMRQMSAKDLKINAFLGPKLDRYRILVPLLQLARDKFEHLPSTSTKTENTEFPTPIFSSKDSGISENTPKLRLYLLGETVDQYHNHLDRNA